MSNCFAYMKKASDDGIREIVYTLQKVLQLYAARELSQLETQDADDALLMDVLTADETAWDSMLEGLAASGTCSPDSVVIILWPIGETACAIQSQPPLGDS